MRGIGGLAVLIASLRLAPFFALLLAVVALLLLVESAPSEDADALLARARAALVALRADIQSDRIVRADVFAMPYHVETPSAVTPDLLPGYAGRFKGKFSVELNRRLADELIRAIDGARLQPDKWGSDLRWGAIYFDQSGMPLHSIYLNSCYYGGAGRSGYIDGIRVRLNGSLIVWFESNFSNGSPACADGPPPLRG